MFEKFIRLVRSLYPGKQNIGLHEPSFGAREKALVLDTIESSFVSSVGKYVDQIEKDFVGLTGAKDAVAIVNGTCALQMALEEVGVRRFDLVLCPALTFVGSANAIAHLGADPVFIDSDESHLGISVSATRSFLTEKCHRSGSVWIHSASGRRVSAILVVHIFGHPLPMEEWVKIEREYEIPVVEDAAESIGSTYRGQHTGTFCSIGVVSLNGNKTITTGGGGIVLSKSPQALDRLRHRSRTAKKAHPYEFFHDEVGYNYRMPNLNAALGVAQLERLPSLIASKQTVAAEYRQFFAEQGYQTVEPLADSNSNFWLSSVCLKSKAERDDFLLFTNQRGVGTRPVWKLMTELPMYKQHPRTELENALRWESVVVSLPSSARTQDLEP